MDYIPENEMAQRQLITPEHQGNNLNPADSKSYKKFISSSMIIEQLLTNFRTFQKSFNCAQMYSNCCDCVYLM